MLIDREGILPCHLWRDADKKSSLLPKLGIDVTPGLKLRDAGRDPSGLERS